MSGAARVPSGSISPHPNPLPLGGGFRVERSVLARGSGSAETMPRLGRGGRRSLKAFISAEFLGDEEIGLRPPKAARPGATDLAAIA